MMSYGTRDLPVSSATAQPPPIRPAPPQGNSQPIKPFMTSSSGPPLGNSGAATSHTGKKQGGQDAPRPSSGQQENATAGPSGNKTQSKVNSAKPNSKPLELRTDPRAVG